MSVYKFIILFYFIIFSSVGYGLPLCLRYGNRPEEVASDEKSGKIVFFDQSQGNTKVFQVWDVNKKIKIKQGELPDTDNLILGFADSNTVVFAGTLDPYSHYSSFGPIRYYHLDTDKIEEFPVTSGLRVVAFNLKARLAVTLNENNSGYSVNLNTGETNYIERNIPGWSDYQSGFSEDGSSYYTVTKANAEYDAKRLAISHWAGPNFFDSDPKIMAFVEPEDVGLNNARDSHIYTDGRSVSDSGKAFALTLSIYNQTLSEEKKLQKLLWLDLLTSQKIYCDVEYGGIANVQIVDEKNKTLLLQSEGSFYYFKTLVNMNTCQKYQLPHMNNVNEERSGRLISLSNQNFYYNTGGLWDLKTGNIVFRSCE